MEKTKDRNFIAVYTAIAISGGVVQGNSTFRVTGGFYLNNTRAVASIEENNTSVVKPGTVIITNIIELNENDYQDWRS